MRLINAETLQLVEFRGRPTPRYVIVSHRWEDEEVTYEAMRFDDASRMRGYYKLEGACRMALRYGCRWVWLDTCCIDKSSSAELTEAINSMYRWYKEAYICLVYLHDCQFRGDYQSLSLCDWFTRGWTLQELIAPANVAFFDCEWRLIGTKTEMCESIARITQIDIAVLRGADPAMFSIAQRFSWAAKRETTQVEDRAYCLLGLFNVSMPMVYGEGDRAFLRLQEEIMRYSCDQTIFGWSCQFPFTRHSGLLAHSPACFEYCQSLVEAPETADSLGPAHTVGTTRGFSMTNVGISICLMTIPYAMNTYLAILNCRSLKDSRIRYGILVEKLETSGQFRRVSLNGATLVSIDVRTFSKSRALKARPLLVRQVQVSRPLQQNHAFWIRSLTLPGYAASELCRAKVYSRDGAILRNDGRAVAVIPVGQFGTACIIKIRPNDSNTPWWRIEYLVLGFDHEFEPCLMLGNHHLGEKSHRFVRTVCFGTKEGFRPGDGFSNSWLHRQMSTTSCRSDFKTDDFCSLSPSGPTRVRRCSVRFLNLIVTFELVDTPEKLDCLKPAPFTVWAVDVQLGDGPSPQTLADRDFVKKGARTVTKTVGSDLPKGIRQVVLGTLGMEALGLDALADLA